MSSTDHSDSDSASVSTSCSSSSSACVTYILDRLKCAKHSDLTRKRKIGANPPSVGKCTCRGHGGTASNPKNVTPAQRVKEYANEMLRVSSRRPFCRGCWEELALKSSSIKSHVQSTKHQSKKKRRESMEACKCDIAQSLLKYNP